MSEQSDWMRLHFEKGKRQSFLDISRKADCLEERHFVRIVNLVYIFHSSKYYVDVWQKPNQDMSWKHQTNPSLGLWGKSSLELNILGSNLLPDGDPRVS